MDRSQSAGSLAHHGVKGMKWGVRKDRGHEGEQAKTKKIAKLDKKFEKQSHSFKTMVAIHNKAADLTNAHDVDRINNKPQYKNMDFTKDTPLRRKYYAEHQKAFINNLEKVASEMGTNASGTKKYTIVEHEDGTWTLTTKDVSHASMEETTKIDVQYDSMGHIVKISIPDSTMAHGAELTSNFLAHYGVKGMKWGVRKAESSGGGSGKSKPPASEDVLKVDAHKATIKAGGTRALSNKELKELVDRMNLEQQYAQLKGRQASKISKGHDEVKKILALGETANKAFALINSPAGKALRKAIVGV